MLFQGLLMLEFRGFSMYFHVFKVDSIHEAPQHYTGLEQLKRHAYSIEYNMELKKK